MYAALCNSFCILGRFSGTRNVSFDSFLSWIRLGDNLNARIAHLFNEYIAIPTLYMMGEDDGLFLPQVEQAVRLGGDNASLVIVPDAGHVCNVDNKSFFNRASLDFIKRVGVSRVVCHKSFDMDTK